MFWLGRPDEVRLLPVDRGEEAGMRGRSGFALAGVRNREATAGRPIGGAAWFYARQILQSPLGSIRMTVLVFLASQFSLLTSTF